VPRLREPRPPVLRLARERVIQLVVAVLLPYRFSVHASGTAGPTPQTRRLKPPLR
jgi:hypothetical protein